MRGLLSEDPGWGTNITPEECEQTTRGVITAFRAVLEHLLAPKASGCPLPASVAPPAVASEPSVLVQDSETKSFSYAEISRRLTLANSLAPGVGYRLSHLVHDKMLTLLDAQIKERRFPHGKSLSLDKALPREGTFLGGAWSSSATPLYRAALVTTDPLTGGLITTGGGLIGDATMKTDKNKMLSALKLLLNSIAVLAAGMLVLATEQSEEGVDYMLGGVYQWASPLAIKRILEDVEEFARQAAVTPALFQDLVEGLLCRGCDYVNGPLRLTVTAGLLRSYLTFETTGRAALGAIQTMRTMGPSAPALSSAEIVALTTRLAALEDAAARGSKPGAVVYERLSGGNPANPIECTLYSRGGCTGPCRYRHTHSAASGPVSTRSKKKKK